MFSRYSRSSIHDARIRLVRGLILASVLIAGMALGEEEGGSATKPPKLFAADDTLAVTIKAPWRDVVGDPRNQDPYAATLEYEDASGASVSLPLTVQRRGVKRQEACKFPPIRLRFDKQTVKGTVFRGQKSLKMVTHCESSRSYEQYYVLEMLTYRMYNLLTDYSFRVRPLSIVYYDSERGKADKPRFAFLIEDDSDVARRNDLKKLRIPTVSYKRLEPNLTSIFSVFQYMIGNVDWAALRGPDPDQCCHNVKLIAPEEAGDEDWVYPVPYDFDSAGFVNAKYAAPPEGLPIRKVTQRLYRGYCWHNDTLEGARDRFLSNEPAIMALVADEPLLNAKTRKIATSYLEEFFDVTRDPRQFEKEIVSRCRGQTRDDR